MRMLRPLHDMILIEELTEQRAASRIELVSITRRPKQDEAPKARQELFRVLAVGPGGFTDTGTHVPMCCKAGDVIVVAGIIDSIALDGKVYKATRNLDVRFVVDGEPDEMQEPMPESRVLQ